MTVHPAVIKWINSHCRLQIFLFIFLAYLLPLGCIVLMDPTGLGHSQTVNFILFGIEAASPTIAALVVIVCFEKKSGIKAFFRSSFSPKLKVSTACTAVIIAFASIFIAKIISCLLFKTPFNIAQLTSKQWIVIAWAFVSEEIGWRGFLTKKFTTPSNQKLVPLLVGMTWAFWHYHFFIIGTIDVAIPLFIAGCIADSYVYALLLTISKGNILIAMVFHTASNFMINLLQINPNVNDGNNLPYATYVVVSAVFAIGLHTTLSWHNHRRCKTQK